MKANGNQIIAISFSVLAAVLINQYLLPIFRPPSQQATIAEIESVVADIIHLTLRFDPISPEPVIKVDDEFEFKLSVSPPQTGSQKVTGVNFGLTYDPTMIEFISSTPSANFPVELVAAQATEVGILKGSYAAPADSEGLVGDNITVGTFRFRVLTRMEPNQNNDGMHLVYGDQVDIGFDQSTTIDIMYSMGPRGYVPKTVSMAGIGTGRLLFTIQPPATADPSSRISCKPVMYKINDSTTSPFDPSNRIDTTQPVAVNIGDKFFYSLEITNTTPYELSTTSIRTMISRGATNDFQSVLDTSRVCRALTPTVTCTSSINSLPGGATEVFSSNYYSTEIIDSNTMTSTHSFSFGTKDCGEITLNKSVSAIPGDFNNDGSVGLADYNILVAGFGNPYTLQDYNLLVLNYGK